DRGRLSRMNSFVLRGGRGWVRLVSVLVAVAGLTATAAARPRASVAPFAIVHGSEGLAHFAPAVTRALVQALGDAGVEVGSGGEWTIAGKLEELAGDRVRLSASVHGKTVSVEGPLDAIDAVAEQLAVRLAPMLGVDERTVAKVGTVHKAQGVAAAGSAA